MDKKAIIDEEIPKNGHPFRAVTILAAVVLVLVVAFVGLTTFTTLYVKDLQDSHHDEIQKLKIPTNKVNYEVDVRLNSTDSTLHDRISIYEDQQLEFNVIMDPDTGLIKSLMTLDFQGRMVAKYDAASEACYFTEMDDGYPSFEKVLNTLNERNGGSVSTSTVIEYSRGQRIYSTELIPDLMTPYCSPDNSYWLEKHAPDARVKRREVVIIIIIIIIV